MSQKFFDSIERLDTNQAIRLLQEGECNVYRERSFNFNFNSNATTRFNVSFTKSDA